MTSSQYSDVRQLYKLAIAYDSFWAVRKSCDNLISAGTQPGDPSYYVTAVGIACTYARPFANNARIGMLSSRLVPVQFKWLHSSLIELRNKGFAHTDSSGQLRMTEVRLVFTGTHIRIFSSRPAFNPEVLPHIKALADLLAQKVQESRRAFQDRIVNIIAPQFTRADVGKEFELNVEDEKGRMVVATTDPIEKKYPVVRPLSDL